MKKEVNNKEILEAMNEFSNQVDKRFDSVDKRFDKIESSMVTKNYLDDKLVDLRGDLVVLMRKEDTKVRKLIEILKRRKVLTEADEKKILSMEPFAQMFV